MLAWVVRERKDEIRPRQRLRCVLLEAAIRISLVSAARPVVFERLAFCDTII
jgi:hypothetical protein